MITTPSLASLTVPAMVAAGRVGCAFQSIVDLDSRQVVAYEALMRGPAGTAMESPAALLGAAADDHELAALDALAHTAALTGLAAHPDGRGQTVFLNIEPRGLDRALPCALADRVRDAHALAGLQGIEIVLELTERALLDEPAAVLRAIARMRERGGRIALDDVGATPESLAFLPLVRPDVVKLDLRLVREHGSLDVAAISNAVRAYAEESGAAVVAEGIETEPDHDIALTLGATLGQGWLHSRPGALPAVLARPVQLPRLTAPQLPGDTPFDVVAAARVTRRATKRLLLPLSHSLEEASRTLAIPPLLLGCFQHARHFTPRTAYRYGRLAGQLPLVAALGVDMPGRPGMGVRGAALRHDDRLTGEWTVIVLGAHYAGALVARDLGDDGPDPDRRFDFVLTHDRALVVAAAQTLLQRVLRHESGGT